MVLLQTRKKNVRGGTLLWPALLLWLLAAWPATARDDLHEATVPVADRSAEARNAAVKAALTEVLVRLSGDAAAAAQPAAQKLLADPARYLQQYQYEGGGAAGELYLRAGFAAAPVEAALRQQGLALWGRERPAVLVWVAVDDGQKRYLLGADDAADPRLADLQAAARRQDIQLVLPLLDLEDQSKVTLSAVGEGDLDALAAASARYQPQAILLGSLQGKAEAWHARWALRHAGGDSRWAAGPAPLAGVLDQSLAPLAGKLTAQAPAAAGAAPAARLRVRVEGVTGLADYARVDQHLRELPPVRRAELLAVQGQRLDYVVDVQGGAAGWAQAVAASALLEAQPGAGAPADPAVYRLRP